MTLFLHEQHELLHLVVNSIRKDLTDHNELFNCLALHAIANVGGREMGEALSGEVHRLLISPYGSWKLLLGNEISDRSTGLQSRS
jgi:AP-2 complex subunit alpha